MFSKVTEVSSCSSFIYFAFTNDVGYSYAHYNNMFLLTPGVTFIRHCFALESFFVK